MKSAIAKGIQLKKERDTRALATAMARRIQGTVRAQVCRSILMREMLGMYDFMLSTSAKHDN